MNIKEIYRLFVETHDTDTEAGEAAMLAAGDNDYLADLISEGLESKHRAGFEAGFRAAMRLAIFSVKEAQQA